MRLYKKNIGYNRLLKLYKTVSQSEAETFNTKSLIDFLLVEFNKLNLYLNSFYITGPYPDDGWKTKKGFLNGLNKKKYKNVHHLIISDSEDLMSLNFQNWSHNNPIEVDSDTISIELMFDEELMSDMELTSLGVRLYDCLKFEYGYIFTQSKKFSISEGKVINGFLSYSEQENPEYRKWTKYTSAIKFGLIRNIYSLNFLSKKHLENQELNNLIKSIGQLENHKNFSIWSLTESEIEQALNLLKSSPNLVKSESFNKTTICELIDKEIKKYSPQQQL